MLQSLSPTKNGNYKTDSQSLNTIYFFLRLRFLSRFVLPPLQEIRSLSAKTRPSVEPYNNGVKTDLLESLKLTLTEIIEVFGSDLSPREVKELDVDINYGLDGSGDHQDHNQMDKKHFSTSSIVSVCYGIKQAGSYFVNNILKLNPIKTVFIMN